MARFPIWQGFEHEWQREVLGFRLPHRLSSLVNYIDGGNEPSMVAGATPGVDGNYMEPQCFYRWVDDPDVAYTHKVAEMSGTDCLDPAADPQEASLELSTTVEHETEGSCAAVLAGIDLRWTCDPSKQPADRPGNSNGVWPVEFDVSVTEQEHEGKLRRWKVRVWVVRGWTPTRGGIPYLEEKPLNVAMDLDARVHLSIIEGGADFSATNLEQSVRDGRIRTRKRNESPRVSLKENSAGALSQFGFTIPRHRSRGPFRNRGRYLSGIGFGVVDEGQALRSWARFWSPVTVFPSPIEYSSTSTILRFGANAHLQAQRKASGAIHSNSSPQAPFFSKWKKFDSNQTRTIVPLK